MDILEKELAAFLLFKKTAAETNKTLIGLFEENPLYKAAFPIRLPKIHEVFEALKKYAPDPDSKNSEDLSAFRLFYLLYLTMPVEFSVQGTEKLPSKQDLSEKNREIIHWYKTLLALREHYSVLGTDSWMPVITGNDLYGYIRTGAAEAIPPKSTDNMALVLVNRHTDREAPVFLDLSPWAEEFLVDALDNYREIPLREGCLEITLAPSHGRLFLKNRWTDKSLFQRQSGILLHPTSLPSNYGIGDLGIGAKEFADFLEAGGQKLWQMLPLNPPGYGNSPYQCLSAFAGNPLLMDMDQLIDQGLLRRSLLEGLPSFPEEKVSFEEVVVMKNDLLRKAHQAFRKQPPSAAYNEFCQANQDWLEDYCLFMALKAHHHDAPWHQWKKSAALRSSSALARYRELLAEEIDFHKFVQYEFFRQWYDLKRYVNDRGIQIIGDLPIYVAHDSCDVWKNPELFHLDSRGNPAKVAGVPPDEFTRTGQLWGNPIYRWETMEETGYQWWKERLGHLSQMVDVIRIDHFRGFEAYWEVPAGEDTAINGRWVKGPGEKFFKAIQEVTRNTKIIAEDLGFITPEVEELKEKLGFPGMSILQFEIQEGRFMVPLYKSNTVAYTGTHDNDTILGWHRKNYLDQHPEKTPGEICWNYIEMVMHSDAATTIIPLQDILCLGSPARMNTPGTATRNWEWRFSSSQLEKEIQEKLHKVTKTYRR